MDNQNNPNPPNNTNPSSPGNTTPPMPTWTSPPANPFPTQPSTIPTTQPEPVSTFIPPATTSPLDNPWSTSVPPVSSPQPTWVPPAPPTAPLPVTLPETALTESAPVQAEPAPVQSELAPTDLSHLISNNSPLDNGQNLSTAPETLVVPSTPINNSPQVPTLPTQDHRGIPKWLIGTGILLLIIVIGASAYFILGIGQPKTNTSLPAEVSKTTVKTPAPIATPIPQTTAPVASGSANFGQLQGGSASASLQATSAADLARQRQQGR